MNTIWKYKLNLGQTEHNMPSGAIVLDAQMQGQELTIWALVNTTRPLERRMFVVVGTGHPILFGTDQLQHIASVQDRQFVWHVMEV